MRSYREIHRDPRIPYAGTVRVLLDFAPWKLALTLEGLNLSASGVLAQLGRAARAGEGDGADQLLAVGDPYQLQIEHDGEHLPMPVVKARLVRRESHATGLALAFAFDPDGGGELAGLVQELGAGSTSLRN